MGRAVPLVKISDDADGLGMRRPNGKAHAGLAAKYGKMRAKQLITGMISTLMVQKSAIFINRVSFHWASPLTLYIDGMNMPNSRSIFLNSPVAGKIAGMGNIDRAGTEPVLFVSIAAGYFFLGITIGCKIF